MTPNGAGGNYPGLATPAEGEPAPQQEVTGIIKVNLNITPRQFWSAMLVVGTMISGALNAGYLFVPAKDSELKQLAATMKAGQEANQTAVERLTKAVDNLSGIVAEIQQQRAPDMETPAQPRRRSNKAKPAAL